MNSCLKTFQTILTAMVMTFFLLVHVIDADSEEFIFYQSVDIHAPQTQVYNTESTRTAKQIIISAVADALERTKIGKNLSEARHTLRKRLKFEYKKNMSTIDAQSSCSKKSSSKSELLKKEPGEIYLSGKINDHLAPVLEFKTRFDAIAISTQFKALDHELDCEFSSPSLNRIMGINCDIGLTSNGSDAEASIRLQFEF